MFILTCLSLYKQVVLGLSTCYDMRFPEMYTLLREQGAQVMLAPSAFTVPTGRAHWEVCVGMIECVWMYSILYECERKGLMCLTVYASGVIAVSGDRNTKLRDCSSTSRGAQ